ncbi:MAG: hypothetical protein KDE57_15455 [Calditrichaeota bacterium]|nr:hypothetical protein [Calditrichota bacterium]MCB9066433.1 hypothetical protein [Calditrichia bacterium]
MKTVPLFEEEQQFRQPWLMALLGITVAPITLFLIYVMISQLVFGIPVGSKPMPNAMAIWFMPLMVLICSGIIWLFWKSKLIVRIDSEMLLIRFFPFTKREIPLSKIREFEARKYNPLGEYGGWGVRLGWKGGKAYTVSGNHGVQFVFRNGEKLLIGSQKATEFEAALRSALAEKIDK